MLPVSDKTNRLERIVGAVQRRWGPVALRRLGDSAPSAEIPHIPTGFPALDHILGIGGIPRSRMTQLLGAPTSGRGTIALKVAANAQVTGDMVAYLDLDHAFDPDYTSHCDVALAHLVLVRPRSVVEALDICVDLVASRAVGIVIFHLPARHDVAAILPHAFGRLAARLTASGCALLVLGSLPARVTTEVLSSYSPLAHHAALCLRLERQNWLRRYRDIVGYQTRVSVLKSQVGPVGGHVTITIRL